jgi:hypothetical protein
MADWAEVIAVGRIKGLVGVQVRVRSAQAGMFGEMATNPGPLSHLVCQVRLAVIRKQHPTHLLGRAVGGGG